MVFGVMEIVWEDDVGGGECGRGTRGEGEREGEGRGDGVRCVLM